MTNKLFNIQLVHLICISYEVGKAKQIEKPSTPSRSVKHFKELDFSAQSAQSLPRLYHDFKCFQIFYALIAVVNLLRCKYVNSFNISLFRNLLNIFNFYHGSCILLVMLSLF